MATLKITCFMIFALVFVEGTDNEETALVEGRGKYKYALLTNLAIFIFMKLGLYKIFASLVFAVSWLKFLIIIFLMLTFPQYLPDTHERPEHIGQYVHGHNDYLQKDNYDHILFAASMKLFIVKIVYGALLFALLLKAWKFTMWVFNYYAKYDNYHQYDHEHYYEHGYLYDHDRFQDPSYLNNESHLKDHNYDDQHYAHRHGNQPNRDGHLYFQGHLYHQDHPKDQSHVNYHEKKPYDADGSYAVVKNINVRY